MVRSLNFLPELVSTGIISDEVSMKLRERFSDDFNALMHLARSNAVPKKTLGRIWGNCLGIAFVDLKTTLFNPKTVRELPEDFAKTNRVILVYQFGQAVTAAFADPTDKYLLKQVERIIQKPVSPVFAFPEDIADAIEIQYRAEQELRVLSNKIVTNTVLIEDITELTREQLQEIAGSQSVVEFVHGLILLAVNEKSSDIHIEPTEDFVRVRFRIDGILEEKSRLENLLLAPIISRLKIMCNLDITERRRPLDGRLALKLADRTLDIRTSFIPTINGEKAVLRLLGQSGGRGSVPELASLNFSRSSREKLDFAMKAPHGIFLITGPTGSGKTTSLFSMVQHMNRPGVNITTVEDPVEYQLAGVSQVQVNQAADLDFANALRAFLRQDPDILLVGEIRDLETAQIAVQAALTGHLVLGTVHANTAIQALTRLINIGVSPYMLAPSLLGIMSQRLVRKICDRCKVKYRAPDVDQKKLFMQEGKEIPFYQGKGCPSCNQTGYRGRLGIHEVLLVDKELRKLISQGASLTEIEVCAVSSGFSTMHYDGIKKVLRGLTTIDEVRRVTLTEGEFESD